MLNTIKIYSDDVEIYDLNIDTRTIYSHTVLAEDKIQAFLVHHEPLNLNVGDYTLHKGVRYIINQPPALVKYNNFTYSYTVNFEHPIYKLYNSILLHLGDMDFSFFGTALDHLNLVIENANRVTGGFSVGTVEETPEMLIMYGEQNKGTKCRNALTMICERFGLEFSYSGQVINLVKQAGVDTNLDFEYGRGKGLYELERITPENYNPISRLYVFGSKNNIPYDYRDGKKRLVFDGGYIEKEPGTYDEMREDSIIFEDIFPNRTSTVSEVPEPEPESPDNVFSFIDETIDFDINANIIAGVSPKVVFKSGDLANDEFDISKYDHETKRIYFLTNTDQNGYITPNEFVNINFGDEYTLIGISLPPVYVENAEDVLYQAGLDKISEQNRVPYSAKIDEKYIRDNGIEINAGDRVNLKDTALFVDEKIRVTTVSHPLCVPARLTIVISDKLLYTKLNREILDRKKEQNNNQRTIVENAELARAQMIRLRQLQGLVFDPDGYFDPERIKPFSIETYMLSVGAKSQNFSLNGVTINPNYLADPNTMGVSAGALVHYEVEIDGLGYVWAMTANMFTGLNPAKPYYLYAKCSRSTLTGTWQISETPVPTEDPLDSSHWNFNVGVLYAVASGRRDFDFTKGMTFIVGDTITTGRIKSLSGLNYFDLTSGRFNMGNSQRGIDWDVSRSGYVTIRGGISVSQSGVQDYIPVFRGNYNDFVPYFTGDTVIWTDGKVYKFININAQGSTGVDPSNTLYWRIEPTGEGTPGNYTEVRWAVNGSAISPPDLDVDDPNPSGWSTSWTAPGTLQYLWMTSAVKSGENGMLLSDWSTPVRQNGKDGTNGASGAFITPRGVYNSSTIYQGTTQLVNAVTYLGNYYVSRNDVGSFSDKLPTDPAYWNPVDGQFDMIATGLILAEVAYIDNLGARYIRTAASGKRIEINRSDSNSFEMFNSSNQRVIHLDDDAGVNLDSFVLSPSPVYDEFGQPLWIATTGSGETLRYVVPQQDVGISIGLSPQDSNGYTALGRKSIYTTGYIRAEKGFEGYLRNIKNVGSPEDPSQNKNIEIRYSMDGFVQWYEV